MFGHIEVDDPTSVVSQHHQHVQNLELNGGDGEEVNGNQVWDVIGEEGSPCLRRWS